MPQPRTGGSLEGPLPDRAIARLGGTRLRAPEEFTSVAYSPDGVTLASASYLGVVRMWDAADGSEQTTLTPEDGGYAVAFSPKGGLVAAAGMNTTGLHLWELRKGRAPKLLLPDSGSRRGGGIPLVMTFSPDERLLAFGYPGGFGLEVWDVEARKDRFAVAENSYIDAVAFSPDGTLLASGGAKNHRQEDEVAIRLWEVATGKEVGKLEGHKWGVASLAFAPDGKTLASASLDGTIRIWDIAKREVIRRIECEVGRVAFSPDGKKLATCGPNTDKVRIFDPATGERLLEIQDAEGSFGSVAFSPDGKTLAVAGGGSAIRLYDATTGKAVLSAEGHLDAVSEMVFSADGKTLASRGGDRTVRL